MLDNLTLKKFIVDFFSRCNSSKLVYAVARNYENLYLGDPGRDLDIIVYEKDVNLFISIIKESGLTVNAVVKREYVTSIYCFGLHNENRAGIGIDLVHGLNYRAVRYLEVSEVLNRRDVIRCDNADIYVTNKIDEALIILMERVVAYGVVREKYWDKFSVLFNDKDHTLKYLEKNITIEVVKLLINFLETGEKSRVLGLKKIIFRSMLSTSIKAHPIKLLSRMLVYFFREINIRVIKQNKMTFCVLGPDGAGKSTIIDKVEKSLSGSFGEISIRHLKPVFIANKRIHSRGVVTDPHALPTRNWLLSNMKIIVWYLELWLDRIINRPRTFSLEIFDRCLYDVLVDPARYRFGGSIKLLHLLLRFSPHIHGVIVIVAPAEVIHTRKSEVTFFETVRQVKEYRKIAELNEFCFINNDQELQSSVNKTIQFILKG